MGAEVPKQQGDVAHACHRLQLLADAVRARNFPPPVDIVAEPPVQSFSAPAAPTRSAGHVRVPRGSEALPERRD